MISANYGYFLTIVEEKSVTKAAEKLFISQPSLSKYIKNLESSLGIELFDHASSPLRLNYAGERYLAYVQQVIKLDKMLQKEFMEIKSYTRGKVVVGIAQWRASFSIPYVLPSFWQRFPDIQIVLREGSHNLLAPLIEKEEVDFCVMNLPVSFKNISFEILMREPILLAVNANNPLLRQLDLSSKFRSGEIGHFDITKARDQLFIMLRQGQNLTAYTQSFLNQYAVNPEHVFETENITTALGLVSAGIGVTFVPYGGVRFQKQPDNVTFFTVGDPILAWDLGVVYKTGSYISCQSREFIEHMKNCFSNS